jgi:hypothetical protein
VREEFLLQVADERQKSVGGGGDRHAEQRRDDQQRQIALAAQQGGRISGRLCHPAPSHTVPRISRAGVSLSFRPPARAIIRAG